MYLLSGNFVLLCCWKWKFELSHNYSVFSPKNSHVIVNCCEEWRLGSPFLLYWWHQINFWRRQWHPTPVLLPGKSHGRSSLVGCNPWVRKESDMTERLQFHFSLSCTGERNGNPLQCSCLENPRDRGAWCAAVYGVAQTWLKWLSSSSR